MVECSIVVENLRRVFGKENISVNIFNFAIRSFFGYAQAFSLPLVRLTILAIAHAVPVAHHMEFVKFRDQGIKTGKILDEVGVPCQDALCINVAEGEGLSTHLLKHAVLLEMMALETGAKFIHNIGITEVPLLSLLLG